MEKQKITVSVAGKNYTLVSSDPPDFVRRVATFVDRKLNVAITRARKQLFILGNEKLLQNNTLYAQLIHYCKKH